MSNDEELQPLLQRMRRSSRGDMATHETLLSDARRVLELRALIPESMGHLKRLATEARNNKRHPEDNWEYSMISKSLERTEEELEHLEDAYRLKGF